MTNGSRRPPTKDTTPQVTDAGANAGTKQKAVHFKAQHALLVAFFLLIFVFQGLSIYLFCSGFLLSRLVLPDRSQCSAPPVDIAHGHALGSYEEGCWHPKSFDKAVIILIDALRYDFTVPFQAASGKDRARFFHNRIPTLYDLANEQPQNAFLRPFIADPPTTTLQRLKALTTGTLPTLLEAGSNFAGTAIDEDNLIESLYLAGKKVVHLGDDTWHSLFPGYFEPNLTRPMDSFNVPDLHSVDNGVNAHIFPLLRQPEMRDRWDVIIGHYLGVDHAGHRYGPDHPTMADKLAQMNGVFSDLVETIDDSTLLVIMGDHGMDVKGDHGGESDDEVEAALFMYSRRGVFGRTESAFTTPPATAKERPVAQIDLVPTMALLLGLPIPFNNLGVPIEEAFVGGAGDDYRNLAQVNRLTAGQIRGFQNAYAKVRTLDDNFSSAILNLWTDAEQEWERQNSSAITTQRSWKGAADAFLAYQIQHLQTCKALWAQFNLARMAMGIVALISTFTIIVVYAQSIAGDRAALTPSLLLAGIVGFFGGAGMGLVAGTIMGMSWTSLPAFAGVLCGLAGILRALWPARLTLRVPYPTSFWGSFCTIVTLLFCVGFAANSFTIWEDEQLLFFLNTFGMLMLASSLGLAEASDRNLGVVHSISFIIATRVSSLSRLCRDEQMANCSPTYYASATSSTSAGWQTLIPFAVALFLPSAIRDFYVRSKNYQGSAVIWIGIALRLGLVMTAIFWVLDSADDNNWYPAIMRGSLKNSRVILAQVVLALAGAAGYSTYIWAEPMLLVKQEEAAPVVPAMTSKPIPSSDPSGPILTTLNGDLSPAPRPKLLILGYANTHGSRYILLPCVWILALTLVQKPMGQGALALCLISIFNVLEIIDANNLRRSPLGPILLALLGNFYFFKTGHQAALASIQWESAFIPLHSLRYPWSPLLVLLNTFGAHVLCALAVPAIALWKVPPRLPGLLGRVAGVMATHILFYAAIALATVVETAWLRRHLMLYRVFMPRMLLACVVTLLVELVGAIIAVGGTRWSIASVAKVFGWPSDV